MSTPARLVRSADIPRLAECLARSFHTDPISSFLFPHEGSRARRLVPFYRHVMRVMREQGAIYTDDDLRGAAVWRAPGSTSVGALRAISESLQMLLVLRSGVGRAIKMDQVVSPARPLVAHWYLAILGTDPDQQGRGVGSSLLAPVLERCDADRLPAYLESSKAENIPFYERHGFRVKEELQIPGGPVLWTMERDVQPLNSGGDPAE
jgi:GNAT superfamily N-acetyltransferase